MKKKKKISETTNIDTIVINNTIINNTTTEILPLLPPGNDSMVHIADITDDFSHTMEPILRMYSAAMSATTARLEIIEDEFKYRNLRKPIHHIDTRLKSAKSILGKLEKKDLDLSVLAFTSIQENGSTLYFGGNRVAWAKEAFPDAPDQECTFHQGLLSRKQQLLPRLTEVISKYC